MTQPSPTRRGRGSSPTKAGVPFKPTPNRSSQTPSPTKPSARNLHPQLDPDRTRRPSKSSPPIYPDVAPHTSNIDDASLQPQSSLPSTLPDWAHHNSSKSPETTGDFPEIISQRTGPAPPFLAGDEWELRTETAAPPDDQEAREHHRQLTHYKHLLVRAQSASSAELHDLHTRLHALQGRYEQLEKVHQACGERLVAEEQRRLDAEREGQLRSGVARTLNEGGVAALREVVRGWKREDRIGLLGVMAEASYPSDIAAQVVLLQRYQRSKLDIIGGLPDPLAHHVLMLLDLPDLMSLRLVSKRHQEITRRKELWQRLCQLLEWREWESQAGIAYSREEPGIGWEGLYRLLWSRERNWTRGEAQSVRLLVGHTGYVTSLKLRDDVLISGSYDESIRVWDLTASSKDPPIIIPAKSVSCLDYHAASGVFAAGSHDLGRVQVFTRRGDGWELLHTLAGHLHGIRAVAVDAHHVVSAGADKALVVWDWRTGDKVVRFGQQTNICVGIQLLGDTVIAVTIDGVIRAFSIAKRDMVAQYRIADFAHGMTDDHGPGVKERLKAVGGAGMISWFEGQGRFMTCATREMIIRMAWDESPQLQPQPQPVKRPLGSSSHSTPSPQRLRTPSSQTRPLPISPLRQRTLSSSNISKRPSLGVLTPRSSPLKGQPVRTVSTPAPRSTSRTPRVKPSVPPTPPQTESTGKGATGSRDKEKEKPDGLRMLPDLTRAPRLLEVVSAPDVERGTCDAVRARFVTSTRFAARKGADRQLYVAAPDPVRPGKTKVLPVRGKWAEVAEAMELQTPGKNPMSLAMDRDRFVYGCTDGTIVVVGFGAT